MGHLSPCKREPGICGNSGVKFLPIQAFLYMQKSQEKSPEKPGVAGLWKSLESPENIFHAFQAFSYVQKSLERPRKPGALILSWLSGLFRFFFWKGPGQLVFLDLILINICFIIKYFIVMHTKLVLFFSQ